MWFRCSDLEKVDLFVGGLYESLLEGSAVGPTFNHVIATQFRNLMKGDRYFYSHNNTGKAGFNERNYPLYFCKISSF